MMIEEIIQQKQLQLKDQDYVWFSEEELEAMNENDVSAVENHFSGHTLMRLPQEEIEFFEWLKKVDLPVWQDLWDTEEEPYLVSISFLHHFLQEQNGFPICDLVDEANYWFCKRHLKPKGIEIMVEANGKEIPFEQRLIAEILNGSIDLWHFCYRNNIPVDYAKSRVQEMHRNDLLVHLESREDLVKYLDI
jgi:hypothetical protein